MDIRDFTNMTEEQFEKTWARVKDVTGLKKQTDLAEYFGVRQSSVSDAKRRKSIPSSWLLVLMAKASINPLWMLNGDPEFKYCVSSNEPGQPFNVTEFQRKMEKSIREEIDNLHAEDHILRLKAMGLTVQVMPE